MKVFIKILDVEIPVDVRDFITPQWRDVLEFFPKWCEALRAAGKTPWPIQPYMLEFAKQLEKNKIRGRTRDQWMQRYFEHFGIDDFAKYVERYKGIP